MSIFKAQKQQTDITTQSYSANQMKKGFGGEAEGGWKD